MDTKFIFATAGSILGSYYAYRHKYNFWPGQAICLATTILGGYIAQQIIDQQKVAKNKK